jgi:hypothetical protein
VSSLPSRERKRKNSCGKLLTVRSNHSKLQESGTKIEEAEKPIRLKIRLALIVIRPSHRSKKWQSIV